MTKKTTTKKVNTSVNTKKPSRFKVVATKINPIKLGKAVIAEIGRLAANLVKFVRASYTELRTVTWLSRKDTLKFSAYVLLFVVLGSLAIALADYGFFKLIGYITTT